MAVKFSIPGLLTALVLGLIILAQPYGAEPVPAGAEDSRSKLEKQVFSETIGDFEFYTALISDVQYRRDCVYPVAVKAADQKEAAEWLRQGFCDELAHSLACFYLAWDEALQRLVVIPADGIPVLTRQDWPQTVITFRNEHQAILECLYDNCYAPGDRYCYQIEVEKYEERWKIASLTLHQIQPGKEF